MIHSDILTLKAVKLELGIDTEEQPSRLYVLFNPLMSLFDFSLMDRTVDDVTCALLGTEYRNELKIDDCIDYFEDNINAVSKELWVTIKCLKFLAEESNAPFLWEDIITFITQNETELIQELQNSSPKEV